MDNAEPSQADAPGEHHGLSQRAEAALDSLAKRLDHGGDLPEEASGPALTEREAAAKLGERRRDREDEADRARQRAKALGIAVTPATDDVRVTLYNAKDPSSPAADEDGRPINPRRGIGISLQEATRVLGEAHSQLDAERRQMDADLTALLGDENNSVPAAEAEQPTEQSEDTKHYGVEYSEQQRIEAALVLEQRQQEFERARAARDENATTIERNLQNARSIVGQTFPELVAAGNAWPAVLESMQKTQPRRYQAFLELDAQAKQAQQVLHNIRAEQRAEHQQEHDAQQRGQLRHRAEWLAQQSAIVQQKVPELNDPVQHIALQNEVIAILHEGGLTDQQIRHSYHHGDLGHAFAQFALIENAKNRIEKRKRAEAVQNVVNKPLPPVMRPGVSQPRGAANGRDVAGLLSKANSQRGINPKEAVRLMQARRGAR